MPERTKLHDDCLMEWGAHKGKKLGNIPSHYWKWFLRQEWSSKYPDLVAYAQYVEADECE